MINNYFTIWVIVIKPAAVVVACIRLSISIFLWLFDVARKYRELLHSYYRLMFVPGKTLLLNYLIRRFETSASYSINAIGSLLGLKY